MHPIERLRFVARATGAPAELLVTETAEALRWFADDPFAMVTACRRVVQRHPTCGPLWWLCSRVLTSADPDRECREVCDEVDRDRTEPLARRDPRVQTGEVVLVDTDALCDGFAYVGPEAPRHLNRLREAGVTLGWLCGPGRVVPPSVFEAMGRLVAADGAGEPVEVRPVAVAPKDVLFGPQGPMVRSGGVVRPSGGSFPVAGELLGGTGRVP